MYLQDVGGFAGCVRGSVKMRTTLFTSVHVSPPVVNVVLHSSAVLYLMGLCQYPVRQTSMEM